MKIYRINQYEAFRMDEQGVRFSLNEPKEDTISYKSEVEKIEVEIPKGFAVRKDVIGNSYLMYGDDAVEIGEDKQGIFFMICSYNPKKVYVNVL